MNRQMELSWVRFLGVGGIFVGTFVLVDLFSGGVSYWRDFMERVLVAGPATAAWALCVVVALILSIAAAAVEAARRLALLPPNSFRAALSGLLLALTILTMGVAARTAAHLIASGVQPTSEVEVSS